MTDMSQIIMRYTLGVLLAFAALNAFAGGYYAMSGAEGVPIEWLDGSLFQDYLVPGLILFFVVGGSFLIAAIAVFGRLPIARIATFTAVVIVFIWLGVQVALIGYVSWMQPVTAVVGLLILFLGSLVLKQDTTTTR